MAMNLDEAEQYLIALKHCETCESNDANDCKTCEYRQKGSSAKCYDAIDVGVDIIHKYKKIEEILDNWTKPEELEWAIRGVMKESVQNKIDTINKESEKI